MYNQAIAKHYSSFRPPLHGMILEKVLLKEEKFNIGLDIGCGTGYSAIALAEYCLHVDGVEPSAEMLNEAILHSKITYLLGTADNLPCESNSVEVITFAGSLFYAKSSLLIKELKRVSRKRSIIIPYDFEIKLDEVVSQYGIDIEQTASDYDHEVNLSDKADFSEVVNSTRQISIEVTAIELAHLLLSSYQRYIAFRDKYGLSDPFQVLVQNIRENSTEHSLIVNIFFSKYQLNS